MGNSQGKQVASTDECTYRVCPRTIGCGGADYGAVNLNQFRLLRVVGKGAFGKVRIVEKKDTGLTFALKYIRKEEGMLLPKEYLNNADISCSFPW